jgi:hypothetical protein
MSEVTFHATSNLPARTLAASGLASQFLNLMTQHLGTGDGASPPKITIGGYDAPPN